MTQTTSTVPPQEWQKPGILPTSPKKDDFVMESLRQATPMVRNMATHYIKDHEELYQIAAVAALKAYDKAQKVSNPRGYLHRAIRNEIIIYVGARSIAKRAQTLMDHYQLLSLDDLRHGNSDQSLYDLVPDTQLSHSCESRDYSRLYAALSSLPFIYRQAICMCFGLCGYGVHCPYEIARILGIPRKTANTRVHRAKEMLRSHTELLDLIGYGE